MEVLINKDNVRHSTETFLPFEAEEVMDLAIAGERNYRIINPTLHAPPPPPPRRQGRWKSPITC